MGAAMAPAAVDTIQAHFNDTGRQPGDYDLIVTGDLAAVGHTIAKDLLARDGVPMEQTVFGDCGIDDLRHQETEGPSRGERLRLLSSRHLWSFA